MIVTHPSRHPGAWIGVALDGTLAADNPCAFDMRTVGAPIAPMVDLVRQLLAQGWEVRVFTARVFPLNRAVYPNDPLLINTADVRQRECAAAIYAIRDWCAYHLGQVLPVTNVKDFGMVWMLDDRARGVVPNQGLLVGDNPFQVPVTTGFLRLEPTDQP